MIDQEKQTVIMDSVCHDSRLCFSAIAEQLTAPHVRMPVRVFRDGNQWCCLYGENLQVGVAGFGDSPDIACWDFDQQWRKRVKA